MTFDAQIDLAEYGLPEQALVFVEAYWQADLMRFDWGTIGNLQPPADRRLREFDSSETILFRVRVTAPTGIDDDHGLLLAEADRVKLRNSEEADEQSEVLLPVKPADLGDELWRINIDPNSKITLLINRNAGTDFRKLALQPFFAPFVYPAAVREILTHIVLEAKHSDYDDYEDSFSRWLRFAVEVLGQGEPPELEDGGGNREEILDWINDSVSRFATKHKLLAQFNQFWTKEDGQ